MTHEGRAHSIQTEKQSRRRQSVGSLWILSRSYPVRATQLYDGATAGSTVSTKPNHPASREKGPKHRSFQLTMRIGFWRACPDPVPTTHPVSGGRGRVVPVPNYAAARSWEKKQSISHSLDWAPWVVPIVTGVDKSVGQWKWQHGFAMRR
jgi:hypothetical protein